MTSETGLRHHTCNMHRVKLYKMSEGINLAMFMHNKPNCLETHLLHSTIHVPITMAYKRVSRIESLPFQIKRDRFYHSSHESFTDTVLIACCFEVDSICEQEKSSRWYSPQKMPFNIRSCVHEQV